ncbi:hypothetical protein [Trueperella pyogenes]
MKIYEDQETGLTYQFSADTPFIPSHLTEVTAPQKVEATATAEEPEAPQEEVTAPQKVEATATAEEPEAPQEKAAGAPKNKARKATTK